MLNKKIITSVVAGVLGIFMIMILSTSISYNEKNHDVMIIRFGEVINVKEDTGLYFKIPFIDSSRDIYVGEQLYDLSESEVITSDKKNMIANCYVTWQIEDVKKYYQTLSSESIAQSRLDVAVYNAMKNVISSIPQEEVISGKDGSLGNVILNKITSLSQYGIKITQIEMKLLDLPSDNKDAVYKRMISEREVIAAEYKANGDKEASKIKSEADANVRKIVSDAEVEAANVVAEGEKKYFEILAAAYSSSDSRQDFYNYIIGLDALKTSLSKGGTVTIDKDSPLYDVLINSSDR